MKMRSKVDYPQGDARQPYGINPDGAPYKVLVVDDSMFIAKQISQYLTSEGFEIVATATDGADAVEKYKELSPNVDVVTMDITMNEKDGLAAAKEILAMDPDARIIMVTALGQQKILIDSFKIGVKDFVVKPFKPERLVVAVQKALA